MGHEFHEFLRPSGPAGTAAVPVTWPDLVLGIRAICVPFGVFRVCYPEPCRCFEDSVA